MARPSCLLSVVLAALVIVNVSATVVIYTVTLLPCVPSTTCPLGNLAAYNRTFTLNGVLSPNISLNVNDTLQFNLNQTVTIHPLIICKNSSSPYFCQGVANSSILSIPITQAGNSSSYTFTVAGIYYYGCFNHPGMGAMITVMQTTTAMSTTTTQRPGTGHQLSASVMLIIIFTLLTIIFI
jgi:hypothetical protein